MVCWLPLDCTSLTLIVTYSNQIAVHIKGPILGRLLKISLICVCKQSMSLCVSLSNAVACLSVGRKLISVSQHGKINNDYLNISQFRKRS